GHDDGNGAGRLAGSLDRLRRIRDDHVDVGRNELGGERRQPLRFAVGEASFEGDVSPLAPAQILQALSERTEAALPFWVAFGQSLQQSDPPHALGLLRARRARPDGGGGEERYEPAAADAAGLYCREIRGCCSDLMVRSEASRTMRAAPCLRPCFETPPSAAPQHEVLRVGQRGTLHHSITSSARASNIGGSSRPSALAALRLITN